MQILTEINNKIVMQNEHAFAYVRYLSQGSLYLCCEIMVSFMIFYLF